MTRRGATSYSSGPFTLDIRGLGRRPGTMTEVHRTVESPTDIGLDMLAIPAHTPVDLDLRLESVSEGVLVTGTVSGDTQGQCSRCLEAITGTVNVFLTELFAYPDSDTDHTTDPDDIHRILDQSVDLEQSVIDAVGLDLPMAPLCREDCTGLCPDCGIRLDTAEPGHDHDQIDPRFASLRTWLTSEVPNVDAGPDDPGVVIEPNVSTAPGTAEDHRR